MGKLIKLKVNEVYQLKITLQETKPEIWRRFLVDSSIKLPDLSKVIQTVMGWTNSHLHQFVKDRKIYSEPDEQSYRESVDYRKIRLNQFMTEEKQSVIYDYDFGDGWSHKIVLEKIISDKIQNYPECIGGKRACPPEDCGGPFGYGNLIEILSDPDNEEYDSMMDWLEGDYDPEFFDMEEVNEMLKEKDFGCVEFDIE
ncbi:MAG TPA: plasmid pRiA4b ORF-3 family protein [Spirochaetota bacterium]|nr:plasmid pRiA4b ORF-3 family protein [Spirochaetota bacterium]HQE58604.1 plasmid pRiA4b ORF-3 family protein [Spirochaetota bacterium]